MTEISPHKQFVALTAWLQTFPEFDVKPTNELTPSKREQAAEWNATLSQTEAARAVCTIIDLVCGVSIDSYISVDQLWEKMLEVTVLRARPLPDPQPPIRSELELKVAVLSNLLDCAVQAKDRYQRRMYIERIMGLKKTVQKVLMALIEQRAGKQNTPSKRDNSTTPPKRDASSTPSKRDSPQVPMLTPTEDSSFSSHVTPVRRTATTPRRPATTSKVHFAPNTPPLSPPTSLNRRSRSVPRPTHTNSTKIPQPRFASASRRGSVTETPPSSSSHNMLAAASAVVFTPVQAPSPSESTVVRSNTSTSKQSVDTSTSKKSVGSRSSTPERKRRKSFIGSLGSFLSPGTLESPGKMETVVADLRGKNEQLQSQLESLQQREDEMRQQMEELETQHRQHMMKLEAAGLDRMQEMQREASERVESLEEQLAAARKQAEQGAAHEQQLLALREEMEVMQHSKNALAETSEKLRKYKERVAELQDAKDALQQEQDKHGEAVQEILRLENELHHLAPVKRQLEEYKIRAIEAEVALVECQDRLRRIEQQQGQPAQVSSVDQEMMKKQREHLQEWQERLETETAALQQRQKGIGEGLSELNPEVHQELSRLRNEVEHLRAFAAKRQGDSVAQLEDALEDAKRLSDRYKDEYLTTKRSLEETMDALAESQQREADLQKVLQQKAGDLQKSEMKAQLTTEQLGTCQKQLLEKVQALAESERSIEQLQRDVETWKEKTSSAEHISAGRLERLQQVLQDMAETTDNLTAAEESIQKLNEDVTTLQKCVEQGEVKLNETMVELKETQDKLKAAREKVSEQESRIASLDKQNEKLKEERSNLQTKLEEEQDMRQKEAEEAQQSLEVTRDVLEAKHAKDMESQRIDLEEEHKIELETLQTNMNQLLEDERKAYRQKDEEAKQSMQELEEDWQQQYQELQEHSASALKLSRKEAQERIDFLKKEHQAEIEKVRKEGSEGQDKIIRKGRAMLEEAKAKAKQELLAIDDECRVLEERNEILQKEKEEMERTMASKVASLKKKLEFSSSKIVGLTEDVDELQERVKGLEREKHKLHEENDRYRRQLGGGQLGGKVAMSQVEKMQKEYKALLEENRALKKQNRRSTGSSFLEPISETSSSGKTYNRGQTLTQIRKEYDEQIENLNDEKRELIMKNSAALTDVQKAEQRAWEREQENSELKAHITRLKLHLTRAEFSTMEDDGESMDSVSSVGFSSMYPSASEETELSFFSANEDPSPKNSSHSFRQRDGGKRSQSYKSSGTSPNKAVLSPSKQHEIQSNTVPSYANAVPSYGESPSSKMAADVFGLKAPIEPSAPTLMEYTQVDPSANQEHQQECKQS